MIQDTLMNHNFNLDDRFWDADDLFFFFFFLKLRFTPCKAVQPLRGIELQKKEAQEKDYSIQEICLERTYS